MDTELDTQTEEAENRQTGRQQRMHMVLFMFLGLEWLSMNRYWSWNHFTNMCTNITNLKTRWFCFLYFALHIFISCLLRITPFKSFMLPLNIMDVWLLFEMLISCQLFHFQSAEIIVPVGDQSLNPLSRGFLCIWCTEILPLLVGKVLTHHHLLHQF